MSDLSVHPIILYVEDEENDQFLVRRCLAKWAPQFQLVATPDGLQAIEWLRQQSNGQSPQGSHLALVLLDLNLPKKNGFEVLEWIRQQPHFRDLPVVIYTSSDLQKDRERAQALGATRFEVKSGVIEDYQRLAVTLSALGAAKPGGASS